MHTPKLSVIIPSYNHQDYIGEAIESVLSQDYTDFELLIADDKSSDNSINVIKKYKDKRIKTFFLTENIGPTKILEFLINNSSGEYIALINSDDIWCQGKLSKQIEYMDSHKDCAVCFTWADFVDENGNPLANDGTLDLNTFIKKNRPQHEWIRRFYFKGNCLCHPSILIKKSVYENLGYYNGAYRQLPDFDYWIRVCENYNIHIIEEVLVNHRRTVGENENTSAVSFDNTIRIISEISNIFVSMFNRIDDKLFIKAFKDDFINKNATSKEELICEKYFLLSNHPAFGSLLKNQACQYFMHHYIKDSVAQCFKEKYNYTQKEFFADNIISFKNFEFLFEKNSLDFSSTIFFAEKEFSADNSFLVKPIIENKKLKLQFKLEQNAKMLRIDPIEDHTIIIDSATAFIDGVKTDISPLNADTINSKHYFKTTDPQYIIYGNFSKGNIIEVLFEVDSIFNTVTYKIKDTAFLKDNEHTSLDMVGIIINNLNEYVRKLKGELEQAEQNNLQTIKNYENSLSWKLTKPLRFIQKLLK